MNDQRLKDLEAMLEAELALYTFMEEVNVSKRIQIVDFADLGLLDYVMTAVGLPEDGATLGGSVYWRQPLYNAWFKMADEGVTGRHCLDWLISEAGLYQREQQQK
ncbi:MAG: hypothetical protein AAGI11_15365 [Pseudomonadota bacterium]